MKPSRFTLVITGWAASMPFPLPAAAHDHAAMAVIRDDCDPNDPGYNPTGGCFRKEGDVSFAEFGAELSSPLAPTSLIGHQAWRMDPPYIKLDADDTLMVRNRGGRVHTFTEVRSFGGGKIPNPALNKGLVTAPECLVSTDIAPGGKAEGSGLAEGNHHFQSCIHPLMRGVIKGE